MLSATDQSLLAFLEGPPVCALVGTEFAKEPVTRLPLYQRVAQWYRENNYTLVTVSQIGPVKLDARAVTRSLYHGLSHLKGVAFAAVPHVLLHGRIIHKEPLIGSKDGCVYYVAAPVTIATGGYIVVVMVKKDQGLARMYLHSVITKEKLRYSAYPSGVSTAVDEQQEAHDTHSAETGAVWTLLTCLYSVNPEAQPHS